MSLRNLGRVLERYKQRRQPQPHSTPAQLDAILATRQGREKVDQNLAVANRCNWSCSITGSLVPFHVHQDLVPTTNIVIVSASAVRPILASARLRFRFDWRQIQRPAPRRPSEMLSSHGSPPNSNLRLHANSQLASFPSSACTVKASLATPGLGLATSGVGPGL